MPPPNVAVETAPQSIKQVLQTQFPKPRSRYQPAFMNIRQTIPALACFDSRLATGMIF